MENFKFDLGVKGLDGGGWISSHRSLAEVHHRTRMYL